MVQRLKICAFPEEIGEEYLLKKYLSKYLSVSENEIQNILYHQKSIDARRHPAQINIECSVFLNDKMLIEPINFAFKNVANAKAIAIIGAGPAGLFAALQLIELGIKPIVFERGKDVKCRRRDLAIITKQHRVNPESNYCFGEGGAGTYSDGKLYTRSSKRGDVQRILRLLVYHGADENILYESHPHIGTNKLPKIIETIRQTILQFGGEVHFEKKLTDIETNGNKVKAILLNNNERLKIEKIILATGHSARDVFNLLYNKKILIAPKPFALGVRVEHPQYLIDQMQYKCQQRSEYLPPASYSIVEQINNKGVFSFCMCPGGIIAPAATAENEIVVNGWSPSKRNNPFANSGLVVSVDENDFLPFSKHDNLSGLFFQQSVEQQCFALGNGSIQAPAQRLVDFINNKYSDIIPTNSYLPGTYSIRLDEVLPTQISNAIRNALIKFKRKIPKYITNEAVLIATESRTSSPIRIPRDKLTFQHLHLQGLFPCGEGAGYAGGIVSAAIDGENCAKATML